MYSGGSRQPCASLVGQAWTVCGDGGHGKANPTIEQADAYGSSMPRVATRRGAAASRRLGFNLQVQHQQQQPGEDDRRIPIDSFDASLHLDIAARRGSSPAAAAMTSIGLRVN